MVVRFIRKLKRRHVEDRNALAVTAAIVGVIAGMVAVYEITTAQQREAEADRLAHEDAANTSRLTKFYVADGDRLERWIVDTDTGKRVFSGYADWDEFRSSEQHKAGQRPPSKDYKWITRLTNPE